MEILWDSLCAETPNLLQGVGGGMEKTGFRTFLQKIFFIRYFFIPKIYFILDVDDF